MKALLTTMLCTVILFSSAATAETPLTGVWQYTKTHLHVPGGGRFGGEEGTYIDVYEEATESKRRTWIFTDAYYSFFFLSSEEPRPLRSESGQGQIGGPTVTDEQKLAEYAAIDVEVGTYAVEDGQLHLTPVMDKIRDREDGRHNRNREFEIVGDMLRITSRPSKSRPELATHEYYKRVE